MNNELISVKKYNKSLDYLKKIEQFCLKGAFVDYYSILRIWNKIPEKIKVEILPTLIKDFSLYIVVLLRFVHNMLRLCI